MTASDFTQKQLSAIAAAPKAHKAKLRSLYANQNAAGKPATVPRRRRRQARASNATPWVNIPRVSPGAQPMAGRIFSPLDPRPIPTLLSEGMALPYTGLVRAHIFSGTNNRTLHVLCNTGLTGTLGATVENGATPAITMHTVPTLAHTGNAGGPTSGRAMKASLSLCNVTQKLHRQGRVYIINAAQRVALPVAPSSMSQTDWNTFLDKLIAHPKCRAYDGGSDFDGMKEIVTYPAGQAEYSTYNPWEGGVTADRWFANIAEWPGVHNSHPHVNRPMSTVFVVMDTSAHHQDYSMSLRSSHYLRYPLDTVPGQAMVSVKTATSDKLNNMRDGAEAASQTLKNVADTVSTGMSLWNIGRSVGRAAMNLAEERGIMALAV